MADLNHSALNMRSSILLRSAFVCLLALVPLPVKADLSPRQARRLITRMTGFELPGAAVRVKSVSSTAAASAQATAEIETVFRLERNELGHWLVREIRTGSNQWEDIEVIANAIKAHVPSNSCAGSDLLRRPGDATEPSLKRARCLIASLVAVQLPSDGVRIKEVSPLDIPLAANPSALVVALVQVEVRFVNDPKSGWRVSELRAGGLDWASLEGMAGTVNEEKIKRARADLQSIAKALEAFRLRRGSYVTSDKHPALIDSLSPRYLPRVIRLDPWHRPYQYQGENDHYTLRSMGPDGKENTADDIVLAKSSQ